MKAFLRYSDSNSGKNRWAILLRKPSLSSFGSRPSTRSRRFALQSTIARDLLMLAFLFLTIFGLPGLFAGV